MLIDQIRRYIRRYDLANAESRVVVALSGGSDSVALALLMRELAVAGEVRVVGLAHFNHRLRASAERDERFCAALAETIGLPILVGGDDVAARAARERRSIEDAARTARHDFLVDAMRHFGGDRVAVGHTRDDQAETFLLRLLRGAGSKGLAAMHPRNGHVTRPLLTCRRAELQTYLRARGVQHVEDETNADVSIPRNRIRAELLPFLEQRFNPAIVDTLADEAELARDEWEWMQSHARLLEGVSRTTNTRLDTHRALDVSALRAAPTALRRLAVWREMTAAADGRTVSFRHVEEALSLIERDDDVGIDAPGQRVERVGGSLVLMSNDPRRSGRSRRAAEEKAHLFRYHLPVPGEVEIAEAQCVLSAVEVTADVTADALGAALGNAETAVVRSDAWTAPLTVRNRRAGDRFRPIGLGGEKKLQDFFVDRKLARASRDAVPLVVDNDDRIVWVAGYGIDEAFRVTDSSQAVVILTLRRG